MDATNRNIKSWAEDDRPREKLLAKGKEALSDSELIAVLIGSGSKHESAVALAQRIIAHYDNNLSDFSRCSYSELLKFKGIGEAKAVTLLAALELSRRRNATSLKEKPRISSSIDAFKCIAPYLTDLTHEEFWVIYLNQANRVLHKERISQGGITGTVADTRIIIKKALDCLASSLIIAHNHPSGNLKPSKADNEITAKIKEGVNLLDMALLDHIIVAGDKFFSFADEGLL